MMPTTQLKEYCNKIVGRWYSLDGDLSLEFNFNDELFGESDMYIYNGPNQRLKYKYGIAVLPNLDKENNYQYYFDIFMLPKKLYYLILYIDKDTMILKYMEPFGSPTGADLVFARKAI